MRDPARDGVQSFFEDVMKQLLSGMQDLDLSTLAKHLVENYMKTSVFNEDIADVSSSKTELTV